jgi:hypothetical protein
MDSPLSLSRKDSLVSFRIAANDVEYLRRSAQGDYKNGRIKAPTLAALAKHLLNQHLRMLKDIDKARMMKNQQPQTLHSGLSEFEETNLETANINYLLKDNYDNDEGSSIRGPLFYELFPDWNERIARKRHERSKV